MIRSVVFTLAAVATLAACAGNRDIYDGSAGDLATCRAIEAPTERKACLERLGRTDRAAREDGGIGPPPCHPASTNPADRDLPRC